MAKITMDDQITINSGEPITLRDFFADNDDGIDTDEREGIMADLEAKGESIIGGGAAAEFVLRLCK